MMEIFKANLDDSFQLFPNPVREYLNIKADESGSKITIFDTKGNQLLLQKTTSKMTEVDFSKGVCFIQNQSERESYCEKGNFIRGFIYLPHLLNIFPYHFSIIIYLFTHLIKYIYYEKNYTFMVVVGFTFNNF